MRYRFSAVAALIVLSFVFRNPADLLLGPESPRISLVLPLAPLDSTVGAMKKNPITESNQDINGDSGGRSNRVPQKRRLSILPDRSVLERAVVVSTAITLPRDSAGFPFVSRCTFIVDPENLPQNARASVDSAAKQWRPVSIMLTNWSAMMSRTVEDALRKAGVLEVVCWTKTELPALEKLPPLSRS